MSLFGICELKNLTAEYVEEQMALKEAADAPTCGPDANPAPVETPPVELDEAADVSTVDDFDLDEIDESAYIDSLLEVLNS